MVRLAAAAALLLALAGPAAAAGLSDRDRDRVFDDLERRLAQMSPGAAVDAIVTLRVPATRERVAALAEEVGGLGGTRRFALVDAFAAELTEAEVYALARRPEVVHVEADLPVHAFNNSAQDSFGVAKARIDAGLDGDGDGSAAAYSSADLVAAVLDTGIDATHRDLDEGKVLAFVSCLTGACVPAAPSDPVGHGTHVAATIAGEGDARADRLYQGVAPAAALVGVRVLDANGAGSMSNVVAALDWVVANRAAYGIEAVNVSLGATGCFDGTDALSVAVNRASAAGLVVAVAAGNEGPGACTIGLPAAASGAITVGAMADLGERGFRLAEFSSRGPTQDGRVKPDVLAPGISITSAGANSSIGYVPASGTSIAAPFVAGVALLMRDANPALSPAQVKAAMTATAVDWGAAGADHEYGSGRLDAYAAIRAAGAPISAPPATPAHAFWQGAVPSAGGSVDIPVTVAVRGFPFAATVVAPGWSSAAQSPDFDLALLAGSGGVVALGSTPVTGSPDRRRQREIAVAALAPGAYTLRVTAVNGAGELLVDISGGSVGHSVDDRAPAVRAVAGSGRRGRTVRLSYRVSDLSGRTSERIRVSSRAGRVLRTLTTPLSRRETGRTYYVSWRAPRRALRLRFCVQAWDAARNASAPSCARLRIR